MFRFFKSAKKSRGFSLVEALVAIAIVGVMLVMYNAVITSTHLTKSIKNRDLALKIGTHKMEELRALGYTALPSSGSFSDSLLSSLPGGSGAMAISAYNSKVKKVTVTVTWTDSPGNPHSVALDTLITENGSIK